MARSGGGSTEAKHENIRGYDCQVFKSKLTSTAQENLLTGRTEARWESPSLCGRKGNLMAERVGRSVRARARRKGIKRMRSEGRAGEQGARIQCGRLCYSLPHRLEGKGSLQKPSKQEDTKNKTPNEKGRRKDRTPTPDKGKGGVSGIGLDSNIADPGLVAFSWPQQLLPVWRNQRSAGLVSYLDTSGKTGFNDFFLLWQTLGPRKQNGASERHYTVHTKKTVSATTPVTSVCRRCPAKGSGPYFRPRRNFMLSTLLYCTM